MTLAAKDDSTLTEHAICSFQYAMRLLFIQDPIQTRQMDKWIRNKDETSVESHVESIQQLCALRILVRPGGSEGDDSLQREALEGREIKVEICVYTRLSISTDVLAPAQGEVVFHSIAQQQLQAAVLRYISPRQMTALFSC